MTLTMLAAVGVFSIRAASLAAAASGYDRQNTQNHYVGEYGMLGAVAEMSTSRQNFYRNKLNKGEEQCAANRGVISSGGKVPCLRLTAGEVQKNVSDNFSGRPLFEATNTSGSTITPGSLGPGDLDGDFLVEITDPWQGPPVAGSDLAGSGPKGYYLQVTLTSTGQVRPSGPTNCQNVGGTVDVKGQVAGNETGRALVLIGPIL
jgi:hypothetical protein